jgi:multicomponent Na+:H+ antiporter subunit D
MIFKGLLFMTMGAVMLRTETTKASELGGLHRSMPFTALFCIVGAVSISALPLSAAFASQSMIMSSAELGYAPYIVWAMLLFASAGVLEHSGIKIPYFAFFSHDSGLRPQEAPFPMLLAMGVASALCAMIGFSPGWFYDILPYRDVALTHLARDLWSPAHLLVQAQLLAFAVLAFLLLKRFRAYPPEKPGIIIDVEWIWRAGAPRLGRFLRRKLGPASEAFAGVTTALAAALLFLIWQAFAPHGWVARRFPLALTTVWILGIVTVVLVASLASTR